MVALKGVLTLLVFLLLTLPLMPIQALALNIAPGFARALPVWYHRRVCKLFGLRVHLHGALSIEESVLISANHASWLDIVVLSSIGPVSFVAKREVGEWPFISWLAKLQRTLFIDRERRSSVADISRRMNERLEAGDNIVLFPEGTSSDGNSVLPFRSSLLAPILAPPAPQGGNETPKRHALQTCAVAYTHLHGLPLGRENRPLISWCGDTDMVSHGWNILKSGPIDVHVSLRDPIDLDTFASRKDLSREIERVIREDVAWMLRNGGPRQKPPIPGSSAVDAAMVKA